MDDDVFTRLQLGLLLGLVTTPTALAWMCCCTGKCNRRGGPPEGAEGRHFPSNARACRLGSLGSDPHQVEGTHRREKGTSLHPKEKDTKSNIDRKVTKRNSENRNLILRDMERRARPIMKELEVRRAGWQAHREQAGEEAHQMDARRSYSTRSTD